MKILIISFLLTMCAFSQQSGVVTKHGFCGGNHTIN